MIKLDARLQTVLELCEKSAVTADVGCDHGFITYMLLKNGISSRVIATDISAPSLDKTKRLLKSQALDSFARFIVCDGLSGLDTVPEQVVIAGMGGRNILEIIRNYPQYKSVNKWILQPMNEIVALRIGLNELGLKITRDITVEEKRKFYHVMSAEPGEQSLSYQDTVLGAVQSDRRGVGYVNWMKHKAAKFKLILSGISPNSANFEHIHKCKQVFEKQINKFQE